MRPASRPATCAVCLDLDPLSCYLDKRGLSPGPLTDLNAVHAEGLARFLELFAETGIRATLFAVGQEAERPEIAASLRAAASAGHEIANHSHSHVGSLARLGPAALEEEVRVAGQRLQQATGQRVLGFRAPGWNVSLELFTVLDRLGYAYDSSLVPLPAKRWLHGLLRVSGLDLPAPLLDAQLGWPNPPGHPYRVDLQRPWTVGDAGLWEVPCGFTPWPPVPLNMTCLAMLGPRGGRLVARSYRVLPGDLVFTFHGLDLVDGHRSIGPVGLRKPGLWQPIRSRLAFVRRVLAELCRGRKAIPLRDLVADAVVSSKESRPASRSGGP